MSRRATVTFDNVIAKAMTTKALLCEIDGEQYWIPLSQIDDDSEVFDAKEHSEGKLIVTEWIAAEKNLI